MDRYTMLDASTAILAVFGVIYYYGELSTDKFNVMITLYFILLTIGYILVIQKLNGITKKIIKKTAQLLNCKFVDSGRYALHHRIICPTMEILINLRGSYTPSSLQITLHGQFKEADIRNNAYYSSKFSKNLSLLERKYKIKIKDAYIAANRAEILITKFPYNPQKLKSMIDEYKAIVFKV